MWHLWLDNAYAIMYVIMANSTSNKSTTTKKGAKKTTKRFLKNPISSGEDVKASSYITSGNIISICILVSCLSAVLVTLLFNFGFKVFVANNTESQANNAAVVSEWTDAYKEELQSSLLDGRSFRALSSKAILGMMQSKDSGFVLVVPASLNDEALAFIDNVTTTQLQHQDPIYAVDLGVVLSTEDTTLLAKLGQKVDDLPTLIYVKDGQIFDRLDNRNSVDNLNAFLNNYRK